MAADSFNQIPPYGVVRNWLGSKTVERLLDYAASNELLFKESDIGHGPARRVDHTRRRSSLLSKIPDLRSELELESRLESLLPAMFERLGNKPFIPGKFEFEMAAHGDGAFFSRHVDTFTKAKELVSHRIISVVYYFHVQPKAFSGGILRLHSLMASGQKGTFADIEPDCDTLIFFPSWFPHEVLPVRCPGGRFLDSRFAINCWLHRKEGSSL